MTLGPLNFVLTSLFLQCNNSYIKILAGWGSCMSQDIFRKIRNLEAELSPKQKILAPYFLVHLGELPFQTTPEIAGKLGVSEPTVIRFARSLGFKGFVEFKDELQRIVLEKYGPSERLSKIKKINKEVEEIVGMIFEKELHNLRETQRRLNIQGIEKIAYELIRAKKKYVVGLRTSSACLFARVSFGSRHAQCYKHFGRWHPDVRGA